MISDRDEQLLRDYLANTLDPEQRQTFEAHLATCPGCREQLEDLELDQFLGDSLSDKHMAVEPPAELHERIFDSDEFASIKRDSAKQAAVRPQPAENAKRLLSGSPLTAPLVLLPASGLLLVVLMLLVLVQHVSR